METKIRVLIADPNEDMRLILSETLGREEDLTVVGAAADGPETLSLVTELEPDVVLLELVLPKLDGLSVLRKLPDTGRNPAVLVMTGFVNSHVHKLAYHRIVSVYVNDTVFFVSSCIFVSI